MEGRLMGQHYDVVVIGAGPAGYIAAIRASQLGLKTLCVDRFKGHDGGPSLGGTCLNSGCIPTKALLQSSENVYYLQHEFSDHGITVKSASFDAARMIARKDAIVRRLTNGVSILLRKNRVDTLFGSARLAGREGDKWLIAVNEGASNKSFTATDLILATGSKPRPIPGIKIDNNFILDNEGALNLTTVPKRIGIIGAGVTGIEFGSIWRRLSAEVTLLETSSVFLPSVDQQIAQEVFKSLTKDTKLNFDFDIEIKDVSIKDQVVSVQYQIKDELKVLEVDKLIIAAGRVPNTEGLGIAEAGIKLDDQGFIAVDEECRTSLPNIWAVGDVVRGPMLAHKASAEGAAVAERIAGQKPEINLNYIPHIIYILPEFAWVGKTEEQLKNEEKAYKKGSSSFFSNGRALTMGLAKGFIKILACVETDRILGVHIFGPSASELIGEAVLAMEFQASSEDLARTIHAHPSLSEVLHEAALAVEQRAWHS